MNYDELKVGKYYIGYNAYGDLIIFKVNDIVLVRHRNCDSETVIIIKVIVDKDRHINEKLLAEHEYSLSNNDMNWLHDINEIQYDDIEGYML